MRLPSTTPCQLAIGFEALERRVLSRTKLAKIRRVQGCKPQDLASDSTSRLRGVFRGSQQEHPRAALKGGLNMINSLLHEWNGLLLGYGLAADECRQVTLYSLDTGTSYNRPTTANPQPSVYSAAAIHHARVAQVSFRLRATFASAKTRSWTPFIRSLK